MNRLTVFALALTAIACSGATCRVPVRPATASCATACERLVELGCPAAEPTPKGASCEEVCLNAERSGLALWGVNCITSAPDCAAADECGGAP